MNPENLIKKPDEMDDIRIRNTGVVADDEAPVGGPDIEVPLDAISSDIEEPYY
jgi:hypothetical protein